jgi:DNA-directed RNA polymerase specialized sigma24 family protein
MYLSCAQELDPELRAKGGGSDLVQETFLKAHRHFDQFHGRAEEELLAWSRRLLLNNLADFRRRYQETQKRATCLESAPLDCGREPCNAFSKNGKAAMSSDEPMRIIKQSVPRREITPGRALPVRLCTGKKSPPGEV